jgi:hypothetical protein
MEKKTTKKITKVEGGSSVNIPPTQTTTFVASDESKAKAKNFRILAIVSWVIAMGLQAGAIYLLYQVPLKMTLLIILIVVDLIFAVAGSLLWKKANRFDPASEKDKVKFFIQNQLGAIIGVLAFLPLVVLIFTNKNMSGKQKGILGTIAAVALVIAGITGVDFNPPSVEQYTEQTQQVEQLNNGLNRVYWTKSGTVYHIYSDCSHINTDRTDEIFEGTVAQARELKKITNLCKTCESRAKRENGNDTKDVQNAVEEMISDSAGGN